MPQLARKLLATCAGLRHVATSSATSTAAAPASAPASEKLRSSRSREQPPSGQSRETLQKRVLHVRSVGRVTKGGKIRSASAIVVVGNGNGIGGYGEGRANDVGGAVAKATAVAIKNMTPIPRFQQRTVFGDIVHRFQSVTLEIKTAPPGFGIVANNNIHEICRCVGIRDMAAKVRGSTNPINVIKASFEALKLQKTPVQIAQARGRKLVDVATAYYGGNI
ncbi:28S ribosomal protein S5, mitochondrial [Entophlyctis luteolus]|nr:28S ribosomal protein S5, mitochondrial [Entophlyctis luteolus]KAJ3352962.1 28S ribosomal protein S5, mitochondrial [Entophlyctis luteolus]KAJ3388698.1 28S ribosomal protein S5, mitochondrial [Entophlyctis sp. JEL0112]